MVEKNNATCSICGKPYYVCLSCKDSVRANPWKIHTDTAEHYKVYQIIHGLSTNVYTKDEAKTKLKNVNLSDKDSFRPHIKEIIDDILKENKSIASSTERAKETVEVETATEEMVVEKPTVSRKRYYKAETK